MRNILLVFLIFIPYLLSAQFEIEKRFKSDKCEYELSIKPHGAFSYSFIEDIVGDLIYENEDAAGFWSIRNDTLILNDTTWPEENVNKKILYVQIIDDFNLINLNFGKCEIGDTLHTIMMLDSLNRWRLSGKIINGKLIEGIKYDMKENFLVRYKEGVPIDTINKKN